MKLIKKWRHMIRPILLLQSCCILLSTPFVFYWTYASTSSPHQQVIYKDRKMYWDKQTHINKDGSFSLKIFDKNKNIKPGTKGSELISLINESHETIHYEATFYSAYKNKKIPLSIDLKGTNANSSAINLVPSTISNLISTKSIEANVPPRGKVDMILSYLWNKSSDENDTLIGNMEENQDIYVGFYIQIDEITSHQKSQKTKLSPKIVKTNDSLSMTLYALAILFSILFLIYLKRSKDEAY